MLPVIQLIISASRFAARSFMASAALSKNNLYFQG